MKRVLLVYLPAAGDALLRGAMPWLTTKPWRPLRIAFPPLPSVLQATLETGQPPAVHGVFGRRTLSGEEVETKESWLTGLEEDFGLSKSAVLYVREDGLLTALARGDETVLEHANELDAKLRHSCEEDEDLAIIVIGGPSPAAFDRSLDPTAFVPHGAGFQAEGVLLRIDAALSADERSRAIMEAGVERVLHGEARSRRGCDHSEAGQTLVVAQPDWGFESDERFLFGREEAGVLGEPFVAVCGGSLEEAAGNWPNAIHDLRIAPTVADHLGHETGGFAERAL
jgi:hypothetical protein